MEKVSYVYMMGSTSRRALYTGVTALLFMRVWQHKNDQGGYFTAKYKCYRLVYFEQFTNVEAAIVREKEIKGWRREKKNKLVESKNPGWKDLAANWYPEGLMKDGVLIDFSKTKA
jgi:putative endonuclease